VSAPAAAEATTPPKAKGKKMVVIIVAVVLLLAIVGGVWFFFLRPHPSEDGEEASAPAPAVHAEAKPGVPPVFLPMDNMVVNLADAGGEKFAQVGITIGVVDQHVSDAVKAHLPTIRSAALMLISQRTSEELLTKEGKEKLAHDILREVSEPLGYEVDEPDDAAEDAPKKKKSKKKHVAPPNPVLSILFSSFIIQ
jgi:flagellar protein FliL